MGGAPSIGWQLKATLEGSDWYLRDDTFPSKRALFRPGNAALYRGSPALLTLRREAGRVRDLTGTAPAGTPSRTERSLLTWRVPSGSGLVSGLFLHRNGPPTPPGSAGAWAPTGLRRHRLFLPAAVASFVIPRSAAPRPSVSGFRSVPPPGPRAALGLDPEQSDASEQRLSPIGPHTTGLRRPPGPGGVPAVDSFGFRRRALTEVCQSAASWQSAAVSVFHRLQELPESTGPLLLPKPGPLPRGSKNIGQALGKCVYGSDALLAYRTVH